MILEPELVIAAGGILASGGVAWGAVRTALNGTKKRVVEINETLNKHVEDDHRVQLEAVQRLARIETKLDEVLGK